MTYLFEISSNLTNENKIGNTDFRNYCPAVNTSLDFKNIEPYIKEATENFILDYIDRATYDLLAENDSVVAAEVEAKENLKRAVAHYAVYLALGKSIVVLSDMGAVEHTNQNTEPVSQWKYKATRWEYVTGGDKALDKALKVIESNLDIFTEWRASSEHTTHATDLFKTTNALEYYASISGRRAFLALLPFIRLAESSLYDLLCVESDTVRAYIDNDTLTELQTQLFNQCKIFVAAEGMINGLSQTTMIFTGNKYILASNVEAYDTRSKMIASWITATPHLYDILNKQRTKARDRILKILFDNPDTFTLWATEHAEAENDTGIIIDDDCIGGIML